VNPRENGPSDRHDKAGLLSNLTHQRLFGAGTDFDTPPRQVPEPRDEDQVVSSMKQKNATLAEEDALHTRSGPQISRHRYWNG